MIHYGNRATSTVEITMTEVDKIIKIIRPSLRVIAPHTYWFTIGFGTFNLLTGLFLLGIPGLVRLELLGVLSIKVWAGVFIMMGVSSLYFILTNNWKISRNFSLIGVILKSAWWLELLSIIIIDHSPYMILIKALFLVWSLLLYLQIFTYIYFTPKVSRDDLRP